MAKIGLSKGLENGRKSGKSQGILKRILSGNPARGSVKRLSVFKTGGCTVCHISLASFLWDVHVGKQCSPRSDFGGIWSGSALFAYRMSF